MRFVYWILLYASVFIHCGSRLDAVLVQIFFLVNVCFEKILCLWGI